MNKKYYLAAWDEGGPDNHSGTSAIGGLEDVVGCSEFPDDLMRYVNESSFHNAGHIFYIEDGNIYLYANCSFNDDQNGWDIFDEVVKLEDYHKVTKLG